MPSLRLKIGTYSKARLIAGPHRFKQGSQNGIKFAMQVVETDAKSLGDLHSRSGNLRRSISTSVKETATTQIGAISSSAIYAAIHEFGGTIKSVGRIMNFEGDYGWKKLRSVTIPARPFLRPALMRNKKKMSQQIAKGINKEF